jgi:hypothetical protein
VLDVSPYPMQPWLDVKEAGWAVRRPHVVAWQCSIAAASMIPIYML